MKQGFFEFFLPTTIPDRRTAARAIAAGSIAGFLLAIMTGISTVILSLKGESSNETVLLFLGATLVLVAVTIGTWKRVLLASLLGLLISVSIVVWQIQRGHIAIGIVLAAPLVGGFFASARGIIVLKNLSRSDPPK